MTETPSTFPKPEMTTIIPDTVDGRPKTDGEITYLKKNNIDEAICQKLRKKDVYKTEIHKIYNILVGQTNEQFQDKATSDTTFQEVKSGRYPIGYLMILKKIWFSIQYE